MELRKLELDAAIADLRTQITEGENIMTDFKNTNAQNAPE